jgi:hypothetical protein
MRTPDPQESFAQTLGIQRVCAESDYTILIALYGEDPTVGKTLPQSRVAGRR